MSRTAAPLQGDDADLLQVARTAFPEERPDKVGVAVSGGSDSMAVLHLFARAGECSGFIVHGVTVDHGLRPEAAEEARQVAGVCAHLGVSHDVLRWQHAEITGNLQDQARRARYRLIADWARARKIGHVVLGHTVDDQAETFLMRLAREAGVDGLSGMRPRWTEGGVTFHRPFLAQDRTRLREYLMRNGHSWIDDPSNEDERFERVRARKALAQLRPLGITAAELGGVAGNLSRVRQALEHHCAEVARRITVPALGDVVFGWHGMMAQPPEVRRRLLVGALRWVASAPYPPRSEKIAELERAILQREDKTLGGCRIVTSDTQVRIYREARAVREVACATDRVWDNRWQMDGPHQDGLQIRALGTEGLRDCPDWRGTGRPRASLLATPAIWFGQTLVAAPIAGFSKGWSAKLVKERSEFAQSLISH